MRSESASEAPPIQPGLGSIYLHKVAFVRNQSRNSYADRWTRS